jgi:VWFA-related protein
MFIRWLRLVVSCVLLLLLVPLWAELAWAQNGDASAPPADPNMPTPVTDYDAHFPKGPASISTADQEGKIKFHTQTILIQVPVIVTDKSGEHVHGLKKEDFHVFENGKEQKVATFEEIVTTDKQLPAPQTKPGEFSNLTLSGQQPRAVTVIALDNVNTPFLSQSTSRRELIKYLADNLDSGQVLALMIITGNGVKVVQGLTDNGAQLIQVLKRASGEQTTTQGLSTDIQANAAVGDIPDTPIGPGGSPFAAAAAWIAFGDTLTAQVQQQKAVEETLNGLLGIAWYLSGVPGRKSLIWATGGFPFAISTAAQLPGGYLSPLYERTMQALDAAQISVYPVDVRGLVGNVSAALGPMSGPKFAQQISNRAEYEQSLIETFKEFAEMTGGRAFYNTNDLASSFKRAADDATSYYLAGYYLDTRNNNAGWRQLKVKVDAKDTEVRAREGFFVTNATMNLDAARSSDLAYALSSPIEGTGVPMSVKWLGTSGDGAKKKTEFIVHMPAGGVSIEGGNGQKWLNFDFAAAAYLIDGKTGKAVATIGRPVATTVPEAQMASLLSNGIDMKNALVLAPGRYYVRVVIRDNVTGKIGSVTAPLTVN